MVLPPIVPLPTIEVAPGGRVGEGRPRANALERSVSAAGVREYRPDDSLRRIHWRTSAHRDSLFVRLFDSTPASDWWILLDMDRHVQVGKGQDATEEHAVILAASLADRGLRSGQAVGLAAQGEQLVWLPPREGEGQRWEVLRSLALVSLGSSSLAELLVGLRPALERCTSLVIITPDVDTAWVEALVPLLRRGTSPTVLLLDPISFAPPELVLSKVEGQGRGGGADDLSGQPELVSSRACRVVEGVLTDLGVAHYVITCDLLDRPEARSETGQSGGGLWGRPVSGPTPGERLGRRPTRAGQTGWEVLSQ
jgi:uncharacterized protein (DUF58 family)